MSNRFLGCTLLLLLFLLTGLALALFLVGEHHALVRGEREVVAQWSLIEKAYRRHGALVAELLDSVRGMPTVQERVGVVAESYARVTRLTVDAGLVEDEDGLARFTVAQDELASAVSGLLKAIDSEVEKDAAGLRDLVIRIEGTEHRIRLEQARFDERALAFDHHLESLPIRWVVRWLRWPFEKKARFAAVSEGQPAPPGR